MAVSISVTRQNDYFQSFMMEIDKTDILKISLKFRKTTIIRKKTISIRKPTYV